MFDWDDLLPLAERLQAEAGDEAAQRTAINRAYYAAYHAAARFVRRRGLLTGHHTHERVWAALTNNTDSELVNVGQLGESIRRKRVEADYRRRYTGDVHRDAGQAAADANEVVETLRRLEA